MTLQRLNCKKGAIIQNLNGNPPNPFNNPIFALRIG